MAGKRRTRGDGGLVQRHDHPTCPPLVAGVRAKHACRGRWVGTLVAEVDGRKRRKAIYGRTMKETKARLDKARAERDAGTLVLDHMTVAAWLTHWLDKVAARNLKPQTTRGYRGYLTRWLIPQLGRHRLTTLRPEHVRGLHDTMRAAGCSEATVRQAHAILRKALKDAVYDGKLTVSPAERVKPPKTATANRQQLTVEQVRTILAATDNARWWLALFYGLRQGEVLGLRWGDVDFTARTIRVEQTWQLDGKAVVFGLPKSKASYRTIPMLPLVEARMKLARVAAGEPAPWDRVFGPPEPYPGERYADYKAWKALLASLDLPPVALHAARNSAASVMEAAGIPDRLVAQILGHSNVQITHGYQSAELERMRVALEGVTGVLGAGLELG